MMIRVGIEEIKSGMILGHPVKNNQGVLLLEAGVKITKKNIRIFKSWGVTEVTIKGGDTRVNGASGTVAPPIKESEEMRLKEKFADVLEDPVMVEIFNAAGRLLNRDLQRNDENSRSSETN